MNQRNVIRGAISVVEDSQEAILSATIELFMGLIEQNHLSQYEIDAIFFSATSDLTAVYPAVAIREYGWTDIPMMCFQEMAVENSMPLIIRMMVFSNQTNHIPMHVYLHEAEKLRPDLVNEAKNASN
jgi:chorismate mutase